VRSLSRVFRFVPHFALGIEPMLVEYGINVMLLDRTPALIFIIPTICNNNMADVRTWEKSATIAPRTSFPLNVVQ
jgi:hypothetical protein